VPPVDASARTLLLTVRRHAGETDAVVHPVVFVAAAALAGLLFTAGCAGDRTVAAPASTTNQPPAAATNTVPVPDAPAGTRFPVLTPVTSVRGRVISVNTRLRFVLADFSFQQMPRTGQRLRVFRDGRPVGEVRVSGPSDGAITVADIMEGEAAEGDQLRAQ
jgi:hypothetical protein